VWLASTDSRSDGGFVLGGGKSSFPTLDSIRGWERAPGGTRAGAPAPHKHLIFDNPAGAKRPCSSFLRRGAGWAELV
jgi:hypothetical protein